MNVKRISKVKTVPESLRLKAANETNYTSTSRSAAASGANTSNKNKKKVRTIDKDHDKDHDKDQKIINRKVASKVVSKDINKDISTVTHTVVNRTVTQSDARQMKSAKTKQASKEASVVETQKTQTFDFEEQIRENSVPDAMFEAKNKFSKIESRIALSAFAFIVFALAASWMAWDKDYAIVGNDDVAYNYGLVGGIMMSVILIYALRKRSRLLRRMGDIKYWYYFHFIFGVVGPVLIVLHTSFGIRSINGGVSLFAMFSIVFSGFIGRYIYTRASYGLRAVEQDLKVVATQLDKGVLSYQIPPFESIEQQLREFSRSSLSTPRGLIRTILRIVFIKHRAKLVYAATSHGMASVLRTIAMKEKWTKSDYRQRVKKERILIQGHLNAVSSIASSRAFEKLAAKWRLLHVPILYVLVLSGLAHVLAVHMY